MTFSRSVKEKKNRVQGNIIFFPTGLGDWLFHWQTHLYESICEKKC